MLERGKELPHVVMVTKSGSQQTVVLQIWQKKNTKIYMYDFPVHDCTELKR